MISTGAGSDPIGIAGKRRDVERVGIAGDANVVEACGGRHEGQPRVGGQSIFIIVDRLLDAGSVEDSQVTVEVAAGCIDIDDEGLASDETDFIEVDVAVEDAVEVGASVVELPADREWGGYSGYVADTRERGTT